MKNSVLKNCTNFILAGSALALAGCSVNPTPVGPKAFAFKTDYTLEIIKRVRCEARDAMVFTAANFIEGIEQGNVKNIRDANKLRNNPSRVRTLNNWELDPRAYILASPILASKIDFDFTFTTTETNNSSVTPQLTNAVGSNIFTLGITEHANDATRRNTRTVEVAETSFSSLQALECLKDDENRNEQNNRADPFYPIRGNINLAKTINTFIGFFLLDADDNEEDDKLKLELALDALIEPIQVAKPKVKKPGEALTQLNKIRQEIISCDNSFKNTNVVAPKCGQKIQCYNGILSRAGKNYISAFYSAFNKSTKSPIGISDTLKFTTALSGGLEPRIEYTNASSFDLEVLPFSFTSSRTDDHQVIVTMAAAQPEKKTKPSAAIALASNGGYSLQIQPPAEAAKESGIEGCEVYNQKMVKKDPAKKPNKRNAQRFIKTAFPLVETSDKQEEQATTNIEILKESGRIERLIDSGTTVNVQ